MKIKQNKNKVKMSFTTSLDRELFSNSSYIYMSFHGSQKDENILN